LLCIAALDWAAILPLPKYNLLFAATYTMNYARTGVWYTGHLWSLAVEEQFYLSWPLLIKLGGSARAIQLALILAVGGPFCLLLIYLISPTAAGWTWRAFPFVADAIAAGCALAGYMPWLRKQEWFRSALTWRYGWIVAVLIPVIDILRPHPRIHLSIGEPLLNLSICYCLSRYTMYPETLGGRFLNFGPVAWIGRLSYSIYLWQQLFMNPYTRSFYQSFPANVGFALVFALASYFTVERPLAGLRARLRPAPRVGTPSPTGAAPVPSP
jgi:peptidoglycan/LPS O-acetylase OafA/YrhL